MSMLLKDSRAVWVIDDDDATRSYLSDFLTSRGYSVQAFNCGEPVLNRLASSEPRPQLLLLDIWMPRVGGLEVLAELERTGQRIPSVVLSGTDQIPIAVQAMRLGAYDYLVKPFNETDLEAAIEGALEQHRDREEIDSIADAPESAFQSSNPRMKQIRAICDQVAQTDVPVLLSGESGVGKEVFARYIHAKSCRRAPFVKVNCAALPMDLLESEMFGHERGAFTSAQRDKPGKFELAGRGTIMLDEIAEMNPLLQAKLLHVLQDGEYSRLGGTRTMRSEARIIAATNKFLQTMVAAGTFREDLYFRLNVISIEIPPLRERAEDIVPLCNYFVERYHVKYNKRMRELPAELTAAFSRYHWPGNLRQLENAIKRFLILPDLKRALSEVRDSPALAPEASFARPLAGTSLKALGAHAADKAERELVFRTLGEVNWNRKEAARRLNICYKALLNKLHRWESERAATEQSATKESNGREYASVDLARNV